MKEKSEVAEDLENEVQEDISKTVEENSSETEKETEEVTASEVEKAAKEEAEEQEVEEAESDVLSQVKNMKKHDASKLLVDKAKIIVQEAEEQMEACKLLLSDDLKDYEKAKQALKEGGLDASEALLLELGYRNEEEENPEDENVVFKMEEKIEPIILHDVSSGRFTGLLLALLGGATTLTGLVYLATEKLGMTLDVTKVPSSDTVKNILSWFGTLIGTKGDAFLGGAFVLFVVFAVMGIIYAIRVGTKGSKNLQFALKQLEEAEEYTAQKGNCKEEMDKVDAHINDAIETFKMYQVLLNEQKGKLQRISHIEGIKEEPSEYHEKSLLEMKDTQSLINAIHEFIDTPMSEEGKLSGKSTLLLYSAKNKIQKLIDRLY
ncbi:MAG: hypothetical protein P794_03520 [Epsilonproteobacteria bacterium (ex Lamellibrachia satsuma)]|nr:MAG: hypothetical protein P794_03520 [Epsilonproteobacteria bacterium (ex Lamellibrachia satsuma)]